MQDYGHIDDETPSLAISVLKNFRRQGIATNLMKNLPDKIFSAKFNQVSLSVQKSNKIALNFYKKLDFKIFQDNKITDDLILILRRSDANE